MVARQDGDRRLLQELGHVVAVAQELDHALSAPSIENVGGDAPRIAVVGLAGDPESRLDAATLELPRAVHELADALVEEESPGHQDDHLAVTGRPHGPGPRRGRHELLDVDTAARDDVRALDGNQAVTHEPRSIGLVLEDRVRRAAMQQPAEQREHEPTESARAPVVGEEKPEAGERVDHRGGSSHRGAQRAVEDRLDREVLDGREAVAAVKRGQTQQARGLAEWIHPAPRQRPGQPAEPRPLQRVDVVAARRDERDVEAARPEPPGQRQSEVVEDPVPVRDERHARHRRARAPIRRVQPPIPVGAAVRPNTTEET